MSGLSGTVTCWGFLQEGYGRLCSVMRPILFSGANAKVLLKSPLTLKWYVCVFVLAEIAPFQPGVQITVD